MQSILNSNGHHQFGNYSSILSFQYASGVAWKALLLNYIYGYSQMFAVIV